MSSFVFFQRARVTITNFTQDFLVDDMASGSLELSIFTKPETGCKGWNQSETVKIKIYPKKPKGKDEDTAGALHGTL